MRMPPYRPIFPGSSGTLGRVIGVRNWNVIPFLATGFQFEYHCPRSPDLAE